MTVRWGRPTGEARGSPEPRDHPPHRQANLRARDRRRAGACGRAAGGRCLGGGDRCLTHSAHARPWLHPPADTGGHPRGRYAPGARLNVLGGLRIVIAARRHSLRRARRTGLLLAVTLPLRGKRSSLGSPSRHCRFGRTGAVPFGLQSMAADTPRSTVVGMIRPRCAGGRPHRDAARAGARWRWAASPRPVDSPRRWSQPRQPPKWRVTGFMVRHFRASLRVLSSTPTPSRQARTYLIPFETCVGTSARTVPSVAATATLARNADETGTAFSAVTRMIVDMIWGPGHHRDRQREHVGVHRRPSIEAPIRMRAGQ